MDYPGFPPKPPPTPEQEREFAQQARLDRYAMPYRIGTVCVAALVFLAGIEFSEAASWRAAVPGCAAALGLGLWLSVRWQDVKQRDDTTNGL